MSLPRRLVCNVYTCGQFTEKNSFNFSLWNYGTFSYFIFYCTDFYNQTIDHIGSVHYKAWCTFIAIIILLFCVVVLGCKWAMNSILCHGAYFLPLQILFTALQLSNRLWRIPTWKEKIFLWPFCDWCNKILIHKLFHSPVDFLNRFKVSFLRPLWDFSQRPGICEKTRGR